MKTITFEFLQSEATGYQLELLIRQYGIPVSGRWARGNRSGFRVPARQAKWATYIFQRAGIQPLGAATPANATAPGALPTAWGVGVRHPGLMTGWVDFLGNILGAPRRKAWVARVRTRRVRQQRLRR